MEIRELDISAQYLAGFFDGEGCVHIHSAIRKGGQHRRRYKARVTITNTHLPTLQAIASQHGGKVYARIHGEYYEGRNIRQSWNLNWDVQEAVVRVLKAMQPYLIQKKAQVDYFLTEYTPTMKDRKGAYHLSDAEYAKRAEIHTKLQELKKEEFKAATPFQRAPIVEGDN